MDPESLFDRDGYVFPVDIFDTDEITAYRAAFDEMEAEMGKKKTEAGIISKEREHEFIWKMGTDSRVLDAVESVLGPDLILFGTHVFCKYPAKGVGEESFVAWHQDVTYWGLEPSKAVSAWIAVDDVDTDNGAMLFIPGSHKHGLFEHGTSDAGGNLLSVNQAIDEGLFDPDTAVNVGLRAGQISVHDGQTIHGSHPNRSDRRRCGLTVRFTIPDVRFVGDAKQPATWHVTIVRGEDRYGFQQYENPPVFA